MLDTNIFTHHVVLATRVQITKLFATQLQQKNANDGTFRSGYWTSTLLYAGYLEICDCCYRKM